MFAFRAALPVDAPLRPYFSGERLYGDDLTQGEIEQWYADEKEGYADLGAKQADTYGYDYHALNAYHGFRHLPLSVFAHALGFGSAYGDEFEPIATQIERLTIVDPSDAFVRNTVHGIPAAYVKPDLTGTLPFPDAHFDLVTCLGVLHHIPNVSYVLGELHRCLRPGAYALVREPVISMGDWRVSRPGLTKRERGIPVALLEARVAELGFEVVSRSYCMFPVIPMVWRRSGGAPYNNPLATLLDAWLSRLTQWNVTYHATNALQKVRPRAVFMVLRKGPRPA